MLSPRLPVVSIVTLARDGCFNGPICAHGLHWSRTEAIVLPVCTSLAECLLSDVRSVSRASWCQEVSVSTTAGCRCSCSARAYRSSSSPAWSGGSGPIWPTRPLFPVYAALAAYSIQDL
jgi:hypothetical protein